MKVVGHQAEIESAQQAFKNAVSSAATEQVPSRIGFPHGKGDPHGNLNAPVYWLARADLWAYFGFAPSKKAPRRYWNAFGLGKPGPAVSIACEINPPLGGIDRRCAGAFARSGEDLYVVHRGKFNAYRGGIPKDFTRDKFDGRWIEVDDGGRYSEFLMVGKLSDPKFVSDLAGFVAAVVTLKQNFKGRE